MESFHSAASEECIPIKSAVQEEVIKRQERVSAFSSYRRVTSNGKSIDAPVVMLWGGWWHICQLLQLAGQSMRRKVGGRATKELSDRSVCPQEENRVCHDNRKHVNQE